MLVPLRHCSSAMTLSQPLSSSQSPPKRPRLSLQIKSPGTTQPHGKSATALRTGVDPSSPTAFNTLSNAYAAAIENSSPLTVEPKTAICSTKRSSLRPQTTLSTGDKLTPPSQRTQTPGGFAITYPDTPATTSPTSTLTATLAEAHKFGPSLLAFTPPDSASSTDQPGSRIFSFAAQAPINGASTSPHTPRRRGVQYPSAPYTHPRSLRSILRNSPLPPSPHSTAAMPATRMSMRLATRAAKRVGYLDPLTQTITTNKYVKSHIDLLSEEESPCAATLEEKSESLDVTMAYTGDETRDGGQTPGPFEEMRRRMAGLGGEPETPGTRKRKRKDNKRNWVWTIDAGDESDESDQILRSPRTAVTPKTAFKDEVTPTPTTAIWRGPPEKIPWRESSVTSVSSLSTVYSVMESDEQPNTSQSL